MHRRTTLPGSCCGNSVGPPIAAVFVVENCQPCGQAIAASIVDGRDQLLAVFHADSGAAS